MIQFRLNVLRAEKELREKRKITWVDIESETGLTPATINRVFNGRSKQIAFTTLETLCKYFECGVGDLLEYVPGGGE